MEFLLAAFGMPIFAAMAVIIESHLSNRTFKHPTTMVFLCFDIQCSVFAAFAVFGNADHAVARGVGLLFDFGGNLYRIFISLLSGDESD